MNIEVQILVNKYYSMKDKFLTTIKDDTYLKSYGEIMKFASKLKFENKNDLVVLSHVVYGWMPTILNLKLENIDNILGFLKTCKQGIATNNFYLIIKELEVLKTSINNSIVGASKFLHFVNPDIFPIWDSRIAKELSGINYPNDVNLYINYLEAIHSVINMKNKEFLKLHNELNSIVFKNYKYSISQLRTIEIIIFYSNKLK